MNFGYLIVAKKNENYDYQRMAYILAMSIKNTQERGYDKIALVTDFEIEQDKFLSPWVFDKIIVTTLKDGWDSRLDMDMLSPWDQTVCLDADMIFTRDISHSIKYFIEHCDLYITNQSFTYRGEKVTSDFYRRTFTKNQLPNLYSFFTFFKKDTPISKEFFHLCREIGEYKDEFKNRFLSEHICEEMGTDEIFALATDILDIESKISYPLSFPQIVHMKGMIQNWWDPMEPVTDKVGFYVNNKADIKIGNYQQYDIIHYHEKQLANVEITSIMENALWKK